MPRHVTELDLTNFLSDSTTSSTTTWSSSKIVAYVAAEIGDIAVIDDGTIVGDKTWSSNKINTTVTTAVNGRIPVITSPNVGNFPVITSGGNLGTSSFNSGSFATVSHNHNVLTLTGFPSVSGQTGRVLSNDGSVLQWVVDNSIAPLTANVNTTPVSGTLALSFASENYYFRVVNGNVNLTFSNQPTNREVVIVLSNTSASTIYVAFPTGVFASFGGFWIRSNYRAIIRGLFINSQFHVLHTFEARLV